MALTKEQQDEVNRIVGEKINEFKSQQEKRNAALKDLRRGGKVIGGTEEQLLSLLEREGLLVGQDGKYLLASKDKYGFTIQEEIAKVLPTLLQGKYSHFASEDAGSQPTASKTQSSGVTSFSAQNLYELAQRGDDSSLNKALALAQEQYS